jgi:membrane-associated phospholipid phosphatase
MKLSAVVFLAFLSLAGPASAQWTDPAQAGDQPAGASPLEQITTITPPAPSTPFDTKTIFRPTAAGDPQSGSFFKTFGHDVTGFFAPGTARIVGTFALAGLAATRWDSASVEDAGEGLSKGVYRVGNVGGGLYMQAGAALATYAIGRATHTPQLASLGSDLVRAQMLTQIFVQGTKFAVGRQRPDGSNSMSFPSGHSASAFATATVVQEHFGWKAGIPAYAFASFVGASRLAAGKHYLSDVVVGAGIGIAAGRTVTLRFGGEKFALGAAPTQGGAMVTFTRR